MKPESKNITLQLFSFLILYMVVLNNTSFSQNQNTNELLKNSLKIKSARIKSCQKYEHSYTFGKRNEVGELKQEISYNDQGLELSVKYFDDNSLTSYFEYEYDDKNNLIKSSEYEFFNILKERSEYRYENGLNTDCVIYDPFGNVSDKQIFEYNDAKQLVGGKTLYGNGILYLQWINKYDGKNLVEEVFYDSSGNITKKFTSEYLNNKKIKETTLNPNDGKIREISYEYPSKFKTIIKSKDYVFTKTFELEFVKVYDKNENLIEVYYLKKEDGSFQNRKKYEYDKNGNLLEETHYSILNEPEKSILYKYTYTKN